MRRVTTVTEKEKSEIVHYHNDEVPISACRQALAVNYIVLHIILQRTHNTCQLGPISCACLIEGGSDASDLLITDYVELSVANAVPIDHHAIRKDAICLPEVPQ